MSTAPVPGSRRAARTAFLVLTMLAVVGCGGGAERSAAHSSTSDEEVLSAARVDDALVERLREVGRANGYSRGVGYVPGLKHPRAFAAFQVGACRNVALGQQTWRGVRSVDEAGGVTEEQAARMADFLRTEFCPRVRPLKEPPLPHQTLGGPVEDGGGGRGVSSPVTWWDRRHPRVSWTEECAARTGVSDGDPVAYRLAEDEVVCGFVPSAPELEKRLLHVEIVFASPVDEDRARWAALALLPSDATPTEPAEGTNPSRSYRKGGCLITNFRTTTMKGLTDDLDLKPEPWASALYYSDRRTWEGAVGDYTGKVKEISLSTGAHRPGLLDELTC